MGCRPAIHSLLQCPTLLPSSGLSERCVGSPCLGLIHTIYISLVAIMDTFSKSFARESNKLMSPCFNGGGGVDSCSVSVAWQLGKFPPRGKVINVNCGYEKGECLKTIFCVPHSLAAAAPVRNLSCRTSLSLS